MTADESTADKHTRLAEQLLADARREIAAGDLAQGSEKLWDATRPSKPSPLRQPPAAIPTASAAIAAPRPQSCPSAESRKSRC